MDDPIHLHYFAPNGLQAY